MRKQRSFLAGRKTKIAMEAAYRSIGDAREAWITQQEPRSGASSVDPGKVHSPGKR